MRQELHLRLSQQLTLTPQLQQAIKLLQLSTLELGDEINNMLVENPFLEQIDEHENHESKELNELKKEDSKENLKDDFKEDFKDDSKDHFSDDYSSKINNDSKESLSDNDFTPELNNIESDVNWNGDGDYESSFDSSEWSDGAALNSDHANLSSAASADSETEAMDLAYSHESLTDYLHRQTLALRLSLEDQAALHFLIESLNDDGYLEESLSELAAHLANGDLESQEELEDRLKIALNLLQNLEPSGVGARSLNECLRLQVLQIMRTQLSFEEQNNQQSNWKLALKLCDQPLEQIAKRDAKKLCAACEASEKEVRAALSLLAKLEPKPGRRFAQVERNVVIPDVIVKSSGKGARIQFLAVLNPVVMPRLRVNDIYANALRGFKGDSQAALQQRVQEARWFIKSIQQRFETILRVSQVIVERQKSFFMHGEMAMRPLILREVAEELELHESTISRVTTAKYMATPFGTFELKYFFGSSLDTDAGGSASSTAVRALIKQLIEAENRQKPLSDGKIADLLQEQGISCARRTVAKYREAMRIPTADLRKDK